MENNSLSSLSYDLSPYKRQAMYYETDQMGVIHHSNYIRWFEEARLHYLEQIELSYYKLEEIGIMIPVLSVSCDYKTSVHFNDTVFISSTINSFNGVKMSISYIVTDSSNGQIRTTGESKHCFVDKEFKPVHMKRDYQEVYEKLLQCVNK